ncbi:hypothetical protein OC842_006471, partial [Tilletia horrida]
MGDASFEHEDGKFTAHLPWSESLNSGKVPSDKVVDNEFEEVLEALIKQDESNKEGNEQKPTIDICEDPILTKSSSGRPAAIVPGPGHASTSSVRFSKRRGRAKDTAADLWAQHKKRKMVEAGKGSNDDGRDKEAQDVDPNYAAVRAYVASLKQSKDPLQAQYRPHLPVLHLFVEDFEGLDKDKWLSGTHIRLWSQVVKESIVSRIRPGSSNDPSASVLLTSTLLFGQEPLSEEGFKQRAKLLETSQ